jgi:hypothetical protein
LIVELFNHISVPVSIILAISVAHLLSGLRDVIAPQRRDWLVTCWYAYLGYLHLLVWWSLFAVHNIANWNLGTFAITMAVPGSLYLALYTLLSDAPAAIRSWNEHFQKIRRWFFFFYGLFIATSAAREILLLGRPLFGVGTGFDALSILNATAGGIWRNRKIQTVVLLIELLIAFVVSVQRFHAVR